MIITNEKRVGFWRSDREPDLPMPVAQAKPFEDKDAFLHLLLLTEQKLLNTEAHVAYRGYSTCRICNRPNGGTEFHHQGFVWPAGYTHYMEAHNVPPPEDFRVMIGMSALHLNVETTPYRNLSGEGDDPCINFVAVIYRNNVIAALKVDTKVRNVKVVALGADEDEPLIDLDLNNGDDGDTSSISFPEFKNWDVFTVQRAKYGANVVLMNPDPQGEDHV